MSGQFVGAAEVDGVLISGLVVGIAVVDGLLIAGQVVVAAEDCKRIEHKLYV